jgi:hypothetical protein
MTDIYINEEKGNCSRVLLVPLLRLDRRLGMAGPFTLPGFRWETMPGVEGDEMAVEPY